MTSTLVKMSMCSRGSDVVLYNCTFCVFRSSDGIDFVKHLFEAHSFETTFRYQCGISSCTRIFTSGSSFDAFRGHCTRKHHNWQHGFTPNSEVIPILDEEDPVVDSTRSACLSNAEVNETDSATLHDYESPQEDMTSYLDVSNQTSGDIEHDADEQSTLTVQKESIKTDAAKFILTLKEKYKLTQASLNYTIKAVDELMFMSSKVVEQSLAAGAQGLYSSPFDDLKTEYQQTKYFKENFGLIVSVNVHVPCQILVLLFMCRSH